jgi:hypothetical protein
MTAGNELRETNLIEALNEDIERELRVSDEHIARALAAGGLRAEAVRRHSAECAAAAMRHATALAAEVLHLGGVPPQFAPRDLPGSGDRLVRASGLFCRYRQRLRMANDLGLFRLEEALREIIRDLRVRSQTRGRMFRLIRIS